MRFIRIQNLSLALALLGAAGLMAINTSPAAYGQTIVSGDISGHVADSTGAVVVNATVTMTSDANGSRREAKTSNEGEFRFTMLVPGAYSIKVSSAGLVGAASHVAVSVGKVSTVNIAVQPASVATEIVVDSSSQPLLQTEDANITTVVDARSIEQLPVPGGDISTLAFTAPGVNLSTGAGYGGFVAFGLPATSNLFTMNGNDIMDPYLNLNNSGASNLTLGANEVADVAIVNNGYTAQYGRYAGAQVNYTTKSGGNAFHGNLQWYWNGRALNANDWINKNQGYDRPFANSNQWSGALGGPIWRNKLFFFFDQEGLRYVLPGGGGNTYIPTTGFMSDVVANVGAINPSESAYYNKISTLYAGASGAGSATTVSNGAFSSDAISDCGSLDGWSPATAAAINAALGAGTVSPQVLVNGKAYGYTYTGYTVVGGAPVPSTATTGLSCSRQFVAMVNNLNTEALWNTRIDQNLGSADHVAYRIHHDWGVQATGTDPINSAFNANSVQPAWDGQLNETHTFNSYIANQLILSGSYYSALFGPPDFNASVKVFPTTLAFTDGIGIANLGGTNYNYPQGRNVQQYQLVDDLSIQWKRHSFKFGVNYRGNKISDYRSQVNKAGLTTISNMVDFVQGTTENGSTVGKAFSNKGQVAVASAPISIYAQDEWAVNEKLKLTLSLRMDHNGIPKCLNNCFSRMTSTFSTLSHDPTIPYNKAINTGLSAAFPASDWAVFQPRFGFSYAPQGQSGRFVIRGGIGLFSDLAPGTIADRFLTNAPNVVSFTYAYGGSGAAGLLDPTLASGSAYSYLASSASALQTGFTSGQTLAQIQAAVVAAGSKFSAPSFNSIADTLHTPKVLEFNLETQYQLSRSDVIDLNFVGNRTWDGLMLNGLGNIHAKYGMAGLPVAQPDTRFNIVTDLNNGNKANYNGLTTSFRHTARYGLTMSANYTYSHALDLVSNGGLELFNYQNTYPMQQLNPTDINKVNYGNADYDMRHSTSFQYVWAVPYKPSNAILKTVVAGWSVSGNLFYRGGYPMSVVNSTINSRQLYSQSTGVLLASLVSGSDKTCATKPNAADINAQVCFKGDSFASVPSTSVYTYGFGNIARNSFRGPHYFNTDLQLNKETRIAERYTFKLGANMYNVLNHANFSAPANNSASSALGSITSTVTPPSSPYGSFMGSAVSGRVVQMIVGFNF